MSMPPHRPVSGIGRVFAVTAFVEALTWSGLLVGMYLEHVSRTTELGVQIFGNLHGLAFVAFVVVTLIAARSLRWRGWVVLVALLAAIPPLMTIPLEIWLRRTGRLAHPMPSDSQSNLAGAADPSPTPPLSTRPRR